MAGEDERGGPKRGASRYNNIVTDLWFPYTDKPRDDGWPRWETENHRRLKELMACMTEGSCRPNQVRLLSSQKSYASFLLAACVSRIRVCF
jgi:hypothetical protein